jgi:hypothetical protein
VIGEKELEKKGEVNESHKKLGESTIDETESSKSSKGSDTKMKGIVESGTDIEKSQISHAKRKEERPAVPVKANKNCKY